MAVNAVMLAALTRTASCCFALAGRSAASEQEWRSLEQDWDRAADKARRWRESNREMVRKLDEVHAGLAAQKTLFKQHPSGILPPNIRREHQDVRVGGMRGSEDADTGSGSWARSANGHRTAEAGRVDQVQGWRRRDARPDTTRQAPGTAAGGAVFEQLLDPGQIRN